MYNKPFTHAYLIVLFRTGSPVNIGVFIEVNENIAIPLSVKQDGGHIKALRVTPGIARIFS
jgi:hypothetical protein